MSSPKPPTPPVDPWANFPGGNPFGPDGPFGKGGFPGFPPGFPGAPGGPGGDMDAWFRQMGIDPSEFRKLVEDMQRNLQDAFKNLGADPSKSFVSGFSVKVGPDGKPTFSSFGNKPQVKPNPGMPGIPQVVADEREPLTDVMDDGTRIAITMELPGVTREDINLNMTEAELEIGVETDRRKYHKRIKLPAKVDPKTTKATYTNGILDVTVAKVGTDSGVKIKVQ